MEEVDESHDVEEQKRARLSVHLMAKRHLPPEALKWPQDQLLTALNDISHLRLDRENIGFTDSLDLLGNTVTNIYLQMNKIEVIENFDAVLNLRFLTLADNLITELTGLRHLPKLGFLDLSNNNIRNIDHDELPQSLVILNLAGNPCTQNPDYRSGLVRALPRLQQLDGVTITRDQRRVAGHAVSDSEDSGEEDEEDEEETVVGGALPRRPDDDDLQTVTTSILLRSQDRVEAEHHTHEGKMCALDELRADRNLPPSSARGERR